MFGGGGGGFLGVGTPELIVVGAVAWAVLGPKELFKLSRQAGAFLGEWQQLGQQARDQFQSALETEIEEDDAKTGGKASGVSNALEPITQELRDAVSQFQTPPPTPFASPFDTSDSAALDSTEPEPLGMASGPTEEAQLAAESAPESLSAEEKDALREQLEKDLGNPASNAANFQEQISGSRNAAVLAEYPDDLVAPAPAESLLPEEDNYDLAIEEAENRLANLRAEKELLALRRKQMETSARRAAEAQAPMEAPEATAEAAKGQWYD